MRTGLLALAAGLLLLCVLSSIPPTPLLIGLACLGLLALPFRSYPLGLALCGLCWACFSAQLALDDQLETALDGQTLWIEGRVAGLPEVREGVVRFELEQPSSRRAQLPKRLRLAWYGGPAVQAGERWRLATRLKRPHGGVNPQVFEYEAWLLAQRIGATGTVKQGERLAAASGLMAWRDALRQRLLAIPAHGRSGAVAALVLGDGSGLSSADWQLLQHTGTVHLMVISGQHIALLAAMLYGLVAGLVRLGIWPMRLPWLPWACGLACLGALGYGLLAGFDVPVQRSCLMVALVLLWRWRFRHLGVWLPFLLALNLVLLAEPLVVLKAGFWLSFGAVALLAWIFAGRLGAWSWWRSWGRAQWGMALGLLPLLAVLGLPVSVSGPLANLIAVPWVSFAVVPLALLGTLLLPVPWLGEALLWCAGGLLEWLFRLLEWIAAWQPAWQPPAVSWWGWLLGALGTLLLLAPSGVPGRLLGLPLLMPLLWPLQTPLDAGRAEIWVLDVGQGQAVYLRTRNHALLYDAGPRFGDFDVGERVVYPSIRQLGGRQLDLMLLSHADNDHAGGALALQRRLAPTRVLSGEPGALPAVLQAGLCVHGEQWQWDGVAFQTWRWADAGNSNQASCVLMVEASGERMLLTGDIDAAAEAALLREALDLRADWLLAPHHGSRSSSSAALLQTVRPSAVLVSRGRHNAFGHPHPQVLERYQRLGASIHDTALHGALKVSLGAYRPAQRLREQTRFWRRNENGDVR
jgi:competence protein ComEC